MPLDDRPAEAADPGGGPMVDYELRSAVLDLAPHLREVFVMVEVLGLRYREVGDVLGVPDGTVKSRMFHARRELIRWLEATEEQPADG